MEREEWYSHQFEPMSKDLKEWIGDHWPVHGRATQEQLVAAWLVNLKLNQLIMRHHGGKDYKTRTSNGKP